jgi:hypothetical protein
MTASTGRFADFLSGPLARAVAPAGLAWLRAEIERQCDAADERRLALALGLTSRKIGRAQLALTEEETAQALGTHQRTVRRDWVKARGWLKLTLAGSVE